MKNIKLLSLTISVTSVLLSGFVTRGAMAESIVISDNGTGSTTEVHAEVSQDTTVTQDNTSDVTTDVDIQSETGNNSTSDNTGGDTSISTGDAVTYTAITTFTNGNIATSGCCPTGGVNGVISGNGSNSNNSISYNANNNTNINSSNNANILNFIKGRVSTGNNRADNNTGNVRIITGGIYVSEEILNMFNINSITASNGVMSPELKMLIFGNGTDSDNTLDINNDSDTDVITTNIASIVNVSEWDLNTGNNTADGNVGNVDLKTGDIVFESSITNVGNINHVTVTCCEVEKPTVPPSTPPPPTTPKIDDKPSDNGRGGNGGGSTLGTAIGEVLPATGLNLFLIALIGNIAMLFLGMYLRLRSGRSPALAVAM